MYDLRCIKSFADEVSEFSDNIMQNVWVTPSRVLVRSGLGLLAYSLQAASDSTNGADPVLVGRWNAPVADVCVHPTKPRSVFIILRSGETIIAELDRIGSSWTLEERFIPKSSSDAWKCSEVGCATVNRNSLYLCGKINTKPECSQYILCTIEYNDRQTDRPVARVLLDDCPRFEMYATSSGLFVVPSLPQPKTLFLHVNSALVVKLCFLDGSMLWTGSADSISLSYVQIMMQSGALWKKTDTHIIDLCTLNSNRDEAYILCSCGSLQRVCVGDKGSSKVMMAIDETSLCRLKCMVSVNTMIICFLSEAIVILDQGGKCLQTINLNTACITKGVWHCVSNNQLHGIYTDSGIYQLSVLPADQLPLSETVFNDKNVGVIGTHIQLLTLLYGIISGKKTVDDISFPANLYNIIQSPAIILALYQYCKDKRKSDSDILQKKIWAPLQVQWQQWDEVQTSHGKDMEYLNECFKLLEDASREIIKSLGIKFKC